MEKDVPLLQSRVNARAFDHFDYSEAFQQGVDSVKYRSRKRWMQPKIEERINREMMSTLIAEVGIDSYDYVDRIIENQISYRDLASLTVDDLELIGFKNHQQCEELVTTFKMLPNQEPSYQSIIKRPESKQYSNEMFQKAIGHIEAMTIALSATNRKIKLKPPENFLMGEKYYASHFVLKALDQLHNKTFEVETELDLLLHVLKSEKTVDKAPSNLQKFGFYVFLLSTFFAGTLTAVWLWKLYK